MTTTEIPNPAPASAEEHVYDAATAPRGMLRHVAPIFGYPKVIAGNTTILANFFRRDLLGRFRGSFLGIFWVLVQPIFLFAIYFFVFGFLFGPKAAPGAGPDIMFALYLFSGIIAFQSFADSTTRSCGVVLENGNLVKKVSFPAELLPIPSILVSLISYAVGAIVFLSVGFSTGHLVWGPHFLAIPPLLLVHGTMCLGIGLLLACLQVLIRDTLHLYTLASQAWFFLTPVFWWPSLLRDKLGSYGWLIELNPMYFLVQSHRLALGFITDDPQKVTHTDRSAVWHHVGISALWAVFFLVIGYSFFCSRKNKFSDLV